MKAAEKPRMVTRNDVAKLAGVSPAVVSYVINSSKFVSEERTKAVLDAIKELNYRPNIQARSLKTNRSMMIAFVCDNLRNDWLETAENLFFEKGYYVNHCYSKDDKDFIHRLIGRQFDAVFMMSNRYSSKELNELVSAGIAVVLYKTRDYKELDSHIVTVVPDYYDGIKQSVSYLALKGHERIALVPPLRYLLGSERGDGYRMKAYEEALEEYGIPLREEYVCRDNDKMKNVLSWISDTFTVQSVKRPTAIICGNDWIAVQIMQYLQEMGLDIPQDVALIGTDNSYVSSVVRPRLSTVDFSKDDFCGKLVDTMLSLLQGEPAQDTYLPVSIVVRESS